MINKKIACIGGGNITRILLNRIISTKTIAPKNIIVSNPSVDKLTQLKEKYNINTTHNNLQASDFADWIFINVRPQIIDTVIQELRKCNFNTKTIISVAAGITMERFKLLGDQLAVVRSLPNPPSQYGEGAIALCFNEFVTEENKSQILELFKTMGVCLEMKQEHINAKTAISSPVISYYLLDAIMQAGIDHGLDTKTAIELAYQTIKGSLEIWVQQRVTPLALIEEAATPGGISEIISQHVHNSQFKDLILQALDKGIKRAGGF